uniref:(California timema) hypothetical protein n=1 Tax=Timema californicum TaxID=61474 RepID=A0A7R9PAI4_TIMCA|nr:unnamed protein product [Timema californicum]
MAKWSKPQYVTIVLEWPADYGEIGVRIPVGSTEGRKLLWQGENCTPPAILDFPPDLFTPEQRRAGAAVLHGVLACYLFVLLATVCDDYFVPSIKRMCSINALVVLSSTAEDGEIEVRISVGEQSRMIGPIYIVLSATKAGINKVRLKRKIQTGTGHNALPPPPSIPLTLAEYVSSGRILGMSDDVAGATFMAAATSSPELFINSVGTFITEGDIGVGTIVGSAVFNILAVPACCGLFAGQVLKLDWWPLTRDCLMYGVTVVVLILTLNDERVEWYEALMLVSMYILYISETNVRELRQYSPVDVKDCIDGPDEVERSQHG